MALTPTQQAQIAALITQEGFQQFFAEAQAAYVASQQTSAVSTLSSVITVTVSDWATLNSFVNAAKATNAPLYSILTAITAAAAAQDSTKLGPLFVALYAASRANFNV